MKRFKKSVLLTALTAAISVLGAGTTSVQAGYWPSDASASVSMGGCLYTEYTCQARFLTFQCSPGDTKLVLVGCGGPGENKLEAEPGN